MSLRYKIVETMTVTDEALEQIVNDWVARGWSFEGIRFAMSEASRRPAMAFVLFTRGMDDPQEGDHGQGCSEG